MINVYDLIAKHFHDLVDDVLDFKHTHYVLKGGRGSTKSSCIGILIPLQMMIDAMNGIFSNAVVFRKVGETLKDSVFAQLLWAIEKLGVEKYWKATLSPLTLTYIPTGQKIIFRSANNQEDHIKIKSIKFIKGYCKYLWYEEFNQFFGMEEIRSINQSLLRGGDIYEVFYSFNPPKSLSDWTNAEMLIERPDRVVHTSTYLDVPREWLGEQFYIEAEELKKSNELAYRNEYLGEATGTGGAVFTNIVVREIKDEEIRYFDNIMDGIDYGYAVDPAIYTQNHYDRKRKKLYIFNEIDKVNISNRKLWEEIIKIKKGHSYIIADSAEPKSIAEMNSYGTIRILGAKKGPDSVEYGIKWLQDLNEIIIDPKRCPNSVREFKTYEYLKDKYGNFISKFPDLNNHTIDATRYSRENEMKNNRWELNDRRVL